MRPLCPGDFKPGRLGERPDCGEPWRRPTTQQSHMNLPRVRGRTQRPSGPRTAVIRLAVLSAALIAGGAGCVGAGQFLPATRQATSPGPATDVAATATAVAAVARSPRSGGPVSGLVPRQAVDASPTPGRPRTPGSGGLAYPTPTPPRFYSPSPEAGAAGAGSGGTVPLASGSATPAPASALTPLPVGAFSTPAPSPTPTPTTTFTPATPPTVVPTSTATPSPTAVSQVDTGDATPDSGDSPPPSPTPAPSPETALRALLEALLPFMD